MYNTKISSLASFLYRSNQEHTLAHTIQTQAHNHTFVNVMTYELKQDLFTIDFIVRSYIYLVLWEYKLC